MKTIFLIAALFSITSINAQQKNVPFTKSDTVIQKQKPKLFEGFDRINEKSRRIKSLIIPTAFITYGFVSLESDVLKKLNNNTRLEIRGNHPNFFTKFDNYLQFSPALAVYGLNAFGIKGKNNFRDRTMILALSTAISAATVLSLKKITKVQRPDGSGFNSFPSGHTTTAFVAAEFLRREYKDVSPWYGIAGYTVAVTIGILRLYNNKHWVSDVVAGAGVGIASTKIAYWLYPKIQHKLFKDKPFHTFVIPMYQKGVFSLSMVHKFGTILR